MSVDIDTYHVIYGVAVDPDMIEYDDREILDEAVEEGLVEYINNDDAGSVYYVGTILEEIDESMPTLACLSDMQLRPTSEQRKKVAEELKELPRKVRRLMGRRKVYMILETAGRNF